MLNTTGPTLRHLLIQLRFFRRLTVQLIVLTRSEEHTSELQSRVDKSYGDYRDLHSFPTRRSSDLNAQYYWSNTQTFANTITFLQTINGTANSANYIGTLPAANVVSNAQLQANLASIGSLSNSSYTATLRSDGQFQLPLSTQGGINAGWIVSTNNVGFNAAGNLWKFGADGTMSSPYSVVISTTGLNFPSSGSINSTSYTGTANNASYLGGNTASDLRTYSDNKAANAYSNAVTYASNASNLTTGTLPYARLGTNVVNTTASFAFSNTITFNGNTAFYGSVTDSFGSDGLAGQILTSSGSGNTYWSSKYYVGSLPPAYPNYGDTWYYTDLEKLFMWINDGGSDYWYDFLPPVA